MFAVQVCDLPQTALHREILQDYAPLLGPLLPTGLLRLPSMPGHWACHYLLLMMIQSSLKSPNFGAMLLARVMRSGRACMLPPKEARSKGVNLCTYHRWFAHIGLVPEPCFQLPLSEICMRRLFHSQLGAHMLRVQLGWRLRMARVARICPFCPGMHVGDERDHVL